jgi:lysine-N-methylase
MPRMNYYAPFMSQHEYVMERYLVNYIYKTLFPFGPQESSQKLSIQGMSIRTHHMLLIVYYAIMKTVLVGMVRLHKSNFNEGHVIKLVQSCSKAFAQSTSYPARAMEILAGKGMKTAASLGVLVQN